MIHLSVKNGGYTKKYEERFAGTVACGHSTNGDGHKLGIESQDALSLSSGFEVPSDLLQHVRQLCQGGYSNDIRHSRCHDFMTLYNTDINCSYDDMIADITIIDPHE